MSRTSFYKDLNLNEGASLNEIKAAFRQMAKTCHPDAVGAGRADVEKFIKAQAAYKKLLQTAVTQNRARRKNAGPDRADRLYCWEDRREEGLDVIYRLTVLRPAAGEDRRLVLPARAQEACPRCLGQGRTLAKLGQNGLYRPTLCPKCEGRGALERTVTLAVTITADQVGRNKIRLRGAGLYQAASARRGDLILELNWTDRLAQAN
jgi:DnaJ-class molecular chaperone